VILPSILIVSVLGTIFFGIATPTEASGVGCIGALIILAARRRLTWQNLKTISFETTHITCMLMWVFFGSYFLIGVFTRAGGAAYAEDLIVGLPFGRWGILIIMQVIMIFMGMFIDWIGILMITGPIFVPIIVELGFCPLWFGILFNLNMQVGFLSPPYGLALFYLKGVAPPEITMMDIYRSSWPFMILQMIGLALVMIFPQIGTWLPGLM
jgi:tripartite ATP-independent transporter DctM subunit